MGWKIVVSTILGYLIGAIPTGVVVSRAYGVDLTKVGSKRTGATNVLRTLGKWPAAIVFFGDFAKGALAVLVARLLFGNNTWLKVGATMASVLGHSYSPFIGFRGGRGVLAAFGGLAVIWPSMALAAFVSGAIAIAVSRYVSLGSLTGAVVSGLLGILTAARGRCGPLAIKPGQSRLAYVVYALALPGFIVVSHRDNIMRLVRGTERKLGERA